MRLKNVLFIQKQPLPYFGVLSLTAMLEANGYKVAVLISSLEKDLLAAVSEIGPDIICISAMSMERVWADETASALKAVHADIPVALGGVHSILYPEDAIRFRAVDYICNSEGEKALLNLIHYLEGDIQDPGHLRGIWIKNKDGSIIRNEVENLTEDISQYIEDRSVYYKRYPFMKSDTTKFFLGSRGCPYKCSFCFNNQMQAIFRDKGKYIRFKRPERLIEEIELEISYGVPKYIGFSDDLFTMSKEWLREFTGLYKKRINIPFMCQIRVEFANEEVLGLLKESGCKRLMFGLETGNEELRAKVLNKRIRNDDIRKMAESIKHKDMEIHTFNILGIPSETIQHSFETVDLNVEIKTDIVAASLYIPFPNTDLAGLAISMGYLPADYSFRDIPLSFHRKSILNAPDIGKQENVHKIIAFAVSHPSWIPFIKRLVMTDNPLLRTILKPLFLIFFFISFINRYRGGGSFFDMVKFIFRFRKSY